ncbi:MAG: matrixin family metalloprotease [Cellvibrionaceae bacterium]
MSYQLIRKTQCLLLILGLFFLSNVAVGDRSHRDNTLCSTPSRFPSLNTPTMSSKQPTVYLNWKSFRDNHNVPEHLRDEYERSVQRVLANFRQASVGLNPVYGGINNNKNNFSNINDEEIVIKANPLEVSNMGSIAETKHEETSCSNNNPNDTKDCTEGVYIDFFKGNATVGVWITTAARYAVGTKNRNVNFQGVLQHEMGHAFGLCHRQKLSQGKYSIMGVSPDDTKYQFGLFPDDVYQLKTIYGNNQNNTWTFRRSTDRGNSWSDPLWHNLNSLNVQTSETPGLVRDGRRLVLAYTKSLAAPNYYNTPCYQVGNTSGYFGSEKCYDGLLQSQKGVSIDGNDSSGYMMAWVNYNNEVEMLHISDLEDQYFSARITTPPNNETLPNLTFKTPVVRKLPSGDQSWVLVYAALEKPGVFYDLTDANQQCSNFPIDYGTCSKTQTTGSLIMRTTHDNGKSWDQPLDLSWTSSVFFGETWLRTEVAPSADTYVDANGHEIVAISYVEASDTLPEEANANADKVRTILWNMTNSSLTREHVLPTLGETLYSPTTVASGGSYLSLIRAAYPNSPYKLLSNRMRVSSSIPAGWESTRECTASGCMDYTSLITTPAVARDKSYSWIYMLTLQ